MPENYALFAALLRPRDVAPHPNFRSTEVLSVASLLALLTTSQLGEYRREAESDEYAAIRTDDPEGVHFLDTVFGGMVVGGVREAASKLANIASVDPDPIKVAVSAIISSTYLAELDKSTEALEILAAAQQRIHGMKPVGERLLTAALLQNMALRRWDSGDSGAEEAAQAAQHLAASRDRDIPPFELSKGVGWTSRETIDSISSLLDDAIETHIMQLDDDFTTRLKSVRRPPTRAVMQIRGRLSTGLSKFLETSYRATIRTNTTAWSSGSATGDDELSEALMQAEFSGHPMAHYIRRLLGSHRYLSGSAENESWQIEEALRLLRQSGSKKDLEPALRRVRTEGPLRALLAQGLRVLNEDRPPRVIGELDFLVIQSAADLLDSVTAGRALALAMTAQEEPKVSRGTAWESLDHRLRYTWDAAIALAKASDREAEVAVVMLDRAAATEGADYQWSGQFARFSDSLWSDPSLRDLVREFTARMSERMPNTVRELSSAVELADPDSRVEQDLNSVPAPSNLREVAERLNLAMVQDVPIPPAQYAAIEDILREAMSRTRAAAQQGHFAGGGLPECDLAVAYGLIHADSPIWPEIADYLLDPRVQRSDKSSALDRLIHPTARLPMEFLSRIRESPRDLMVAPAGFFTDQIDPYPEALRFLAVNDLVDAEELVELCGRLLSSGDSIARAEGSQTIQAIAAHFRDTDWMYPSVMGASFDPDYTVRSEAAGSLGYMRRRGSRSLVAIEQRIETLLEEDGMRVPLLALFGIRQTDVPMSSRLRSKVVSISATHLHRRVREQASLVLEHFDHQDP